MGKNLKNKELLALMNDYQLFMSAEKEVTMPIKVSGEKLNHPTSLYAEGRVEYAGNFGNVSFDCEMRNKRTDNYTFQLLTDKIKNRLLFRLDQGNGTHRNNYPNIKLQEQSIPTPHFHKYTEEGYLIAYQTDELKENSLMNIFEGVKSFCKEAKIGHGDGADAEVQIRNNGEIPFKEDIDPLNGVNFK